MMINRPALVVTPSQPFLDWLHTIDPTARNLTLADLAEDPDVYLLPEAKTERGAMFHLRRLCPLIFEEQLNGWYCDPDTWPQKRGWPEFKRWFVYTRHSVILDLCPAPIERS